MKRRFTLPSYAAGATLLSLTLVLGSCSSAKQAPEEPTADETALVEGMRGTTDGGDPVDGGTLTFGAYAQPSSLDPAGTIAAASTGGIEMANVYDTLMRYDSEKKKFVAQLAKKIEANEDFDTFTMTLRDDVTFSDGKPLDAAAVVWSQKRYASAPAPEAALWNANVKNVEATDDHTVVYTLAKPWPGFPSILSTGPGMIVAKSSTAGSGDDFVPVGAGPFTLERWAQDEEMVLEAREDYWDGAANLDEVRIVYLNGQEASLESLKSGGIDMTFVRDPDIVDEVIKDDLPGYVNMVSAGNVALINAEEGHPGEDPRVRRAMALAIDPELINQRAFGGVGLFGDELFGDYSMWHSETEGPAHDPEKAKKLVEAAKADGWDGTVEYLDSTDAASKATSQAVKASLEAVGMSVKLRPMRTIAEQITAVAVDGDYDVAAWGVNFREADPFSRLFTTLHSSGTQVYGKHTSPTMDGLIEQLQSAPDKDEKIRVMDQIQQEYNKTVPFLNWGPYSEYVVWDKDVHGVVGTTSSMVQLADAWVEE